MNKRIKKKIEKKKNSKRMSSIMDQISKEFKIKKKTFGSGYFLFYHGEFTVCHFQLKDTPGWKYGIWLYPDSYVVFGEHEELIDKFKPTAVYLSSENLDDFICDVKAIKEYPKKEFIKSLKGDDFDWTEEEVDKEFEIYWKEKSQYKEEKIRANNIILDFLKTLPNTEKEIKGIEIYQCSIKGVRMYPRYSVDILFDNQVDDATLLRVVDKAIEELESLLESDECKMRTDGYEISYRERFLPQKIVRSFS